MSISGLVFDPVMTVFVLRAASSSVFGRAAVGAHVFRSARGPGTIILLKVVAGAKLVSWSVRWAVWRGLVAFVHLNVLGEPDEGVVALALWKAASTSEVEQDSLTA